jgi:hypothetical protein
VSFAAHLTENNCEQMTLLREPECEQNPDAVVKGLRLSNSHLKTALQMADDFVDSFFGIHYYHGSLQCKAIEDYLFLHSAFCLPLRLCPISKTTFSQKHRHNSSKYTQKCSRLLIISSLSLGSCRAVNRPHNPNSSYVQTRIQRAVRLPTVWG